MEILVMIVVPIVVALVASTGFWAIIQKQMDKKDNKTKMLLGLGHDRIVSLGMMYIKRGYITADEYENLVDYLFVPYDGLHGNGSGSRIIKEVKKLPIRDSNYQKKNVNRKPVVTTDEEENPD